MSDPKKPGESQPQEDLVDEEIATDGPEPDPDADTDDEVGEESGDRDSDQSEDELAGTDEGEEDGRTETLKPPSRAQRRIQALDTRAKQAEARAQEAERQLNEFRQTGLRQQTAEQQRQEQERLALMDPAERAEYRLAQFEQRQVQRDGLIQMQLADARDAAAFDALCAREPFAADLKEDVEKTLLEVRRGGGTTTRETVLNYLLGQRARQRAARVKTKQTKQGQARIQRETVRPRTAGSDVQRGAERGGSERERRAKRLENLEI